MISTRSSCKISTNQSKHLLKSCCNNIPDPQLSETPSPSLWTLFKVIPNLSWIIPKTFQPFSVCLSCILKLQTFQDYIVPLKNCHKIFSTLQPGYPRTFPNPTKTHPSASAPTGHQVTASAMRLMPSGRTPRRRMPRIVSSRGSSQPLTWPSWVGKKEVKRLVLWEVHVFYGGLWCLWPSWTLVIFIEGLARFVWFGSGGGLWGVLYRLGFLNLKTL